MFSWSYAETLKLILDQGSQNFSVGNAIKLIVITKEQNLAFPVTHVALGIKQFVLTLMQVFLHYIVVIKNYILYIDSIKQQQTIAQ